MLSTGEGKYKGSKKKLTAAFAADLIGHIHSLQADGITTLNGLAQRLNDEGIPTSRNATWTATAVRRVLAREVAA